MWLNWEGKRIGLDFETCDPGLRKMGPGFFREDAYVVGVSVALEDGRSAYYPVRHEGGGNLPLDSVVNYLHDQLVYFRGELVMANASYDLAALRSLDISPPRQKIRDVLIADALLYEHHQSYSLQAVSERWGLGGKVEIKGDKAEIWKMPVSAVEEYAKKDALLPLQLLRMMDPVIDAKGLRSTWDLECDLIPVLVGMRERGVRIDLEQLERVGEECLVVETAALDFILQQTGVAVAPFAPRSVMQALVAAGVDLSLLPRTDTGAPSTGKEALAALSHPIAAKVVEARKAAKLRTAFVAGLRSSAVNGRIHATYSQIRAGGWGEEHGTISGRMACKNPNLQQVPRRGALGAAVRKCFLPDEGQLWAKADFAGQEVRISHHYAARLEMPGWSALVDAYARDPMTDFHERTAKMMGISRDHAKTVYLGLSYGMGALKLAKALGHPVRVVDGEEYAGEATMNLLNSFNEMCPFLRPMSQHLDKQARRMGFITTDGGRRLHFPHSPRGGYDWTYAAANRLIQGTAADQTKRALLDVWKAGLVPLTCVHDEINLSVDDEAGGRRLAESMVESMRLRVPVASELSMGRTWGTLEKAGVAIRGQPVSWR